MKNKKYPVVTLCGSTRFKDEFMQAQKELTLKGYIVISVGLFGHSGDEEVWEGKSENEITETKLMLDDMHKSKIDMSDEIYVVNPGGYIGDSTWSEICYAYMTGKHVDSLEPISMVEIKGRTNEHINMAEELAARQFDIWSHLLSDHTVEYLLDQLVHITHKGYTTVDPWVPEDEKVPVNDDPFIGHADKNCGYDPFKIYTKEKMARFVEDIILKEEIKNKVAPKTAEISEKRREMMNQIEWYCEQLDMAYPAGYPDEMTDEQMKKWIETWDEYDPNPGM